MATRGVIRAAARLVGGMLGLAAAAYIALLAVNRHDEPPSADARRLVALMEARAPVPDASNGYVHLLGMDAPRDADSVALGAQRKAFLETFAVPRGARRAPQLPGAKHEVDASRPGPLAQLARTCAKGDASCGDLLRARPHLVARWLADEGWLLDRYRAMTAQSHWRETLTRDARMPLPRYTSALDGQTLALLHLREQARRGDVAAVREGLETDLRYWRIVLASSDLLITKMIAGAAIRRHFALGNVVLRELPAAQAASAIPALWRQPLTATERSMARAYAGEWHFSAGLAAFGEDGLAEAEASFGARLQARALRPMYQQQATLNRMAERMVRLGALSEVPYPRLQATVRDQYARNEAEQRWFSVYNPVGTVLRSIALGAGYENYILAISDLEGARRVAVLATLLRAQGVTAGAAAQAIAASDLRDPYRDAPFAWDAAQRSILFTGLQRGERAHLRIAL